MRRSLGVVLASLVGVAGAVAAPAGLQITDDQIFALVQALKGKVITLEEHDLLVELGEEAAGAEDALPGDLIFTGWALVFADRPELGYPLLREGLGRPPLLASDALRNLLLAEEFGQDALARGIIEFSAGINEVAAKRLRRSIYLPQEFDAAARRARRDLKGLSSGELVLEGAEGPLVSWFVAPDPLPEAPRVVILLADSGRLDGLPRSCQSADRLREAAGWAREGAVAILPGLRGCDLSDGLFLGSDHAEADLGLLLPRLRGDFEASSVELHGRGTAGLLVLELADRGLPADRFVATEPLDPRVWLHLPRERTASRAEALTAASRQPEVVEIVGEVDDAPRATRGKRK